MKLLRVGKKGSETVAALDDDHAGIAAVLLALDMLGKRSCLIFND